jgi:hypothetical protein
MELKRLITHFTYRIEAKPEGGFVAHATDLTIPPLEAATREELQQKIQTNIAAALAEEFPGLKPPVNDQELKFAFHIEQKPGGGFAIHSADPHVQPIEGATHEEIESHFAEKLIGFVGKHLMPELSQALAAQGNSGDIKVFINRKMGFTAKAGSHTVSLGVGRSLPPSTSVQPDDIMEDADLGDAKTTKANLESIGGTIGNSPITPETNSSWTIFRFLLVLFIFVTMMYLFFRHR